MAVLYSSIATANATNVLSSNHVIFLVFIALKKQITV